MPPEVMDKYRKVSPIRPDEYGLFPAPPPPVESPPELTAPEPSVSADPPAIPPPSVMTGPIGATPPPVIAKPVTPPPGPPPPVATPEQDRLRQMIAAGPRTSKLGMIAGGLVRAGAAYANSNNPSRPIAHVNNEVLGDWAKRSPTGGPWREGMQRQTQLAGLEAGDVARQQAATKAATDQAHTQAQTELARKQGDYYDTHGVVLKQEKDIKAAQERDRYKNTQMARVEQVGGAKREVVNYRKGTPPPAGGWYKMEDPYDDQMMIAVRAHPGEEIDAELAKRMNIAQNADGKYYLTAGGASRAYASDNTAGTAAERREAAEKTEKERVREFDARLGETQARTDLTRQQMADTQAARQQGDRDRAQAAIEKLQKEEQDLHAQRTAYGQRIASIKAGATVMDPKTGGQVVITSQNVDAIRMAYQEKYDAATAQAERAHEAQRKLIERHGGEAGPALGLQKAPQKPPPPPPPPPVATGAASGGGPVAATKTTPAPVEQHENKRNFVGAKNATFPRARLLDYAQTAFGGDVAKTEQYLKAQGWVIQ